MFLIQYRFILFKNRFRYKRTNVTVESNLKLANTLKQLLREIHTTCIFYSLKYYETTLVSREYYSFVFFPLSLFAVGGSSATCWTGV